MKTSHVLVSVLSVLTLSIPMAAASYGSPQQVMDAYYSEIKLESSINEEIQAGGGGTDAIYENSYYPGYEDSISINLNLETEVSAKSVLIDANYDQTGSDRQEIQDSLDEKYEDLKLALGSYVEINNKIINIWPSYCYELCEENTNMTGNLSVNLRVLQVENLDLVKSIVESAGLNSWVNIEVDQETKIAAELSKVSQIKSLIEKKKKVYEEILGEELTDISYLYIDSWADSYYYNEETNMVRLNISINVNYRIGGGSN